MEENHHFGFTGDRRRRIVEFMGGSGDDPTSATCGFISRCDGSVPYDPGQIRPPDSLDGYLRGDLDTARSLHDRDSYVAHLDMEYVNFDDHFASFHDPGRAFGLQEPTVKTVRRILGEFGIRPFHLLTGQGHHFVWRVTKSSLAGAGLRGLIPDGRGAKNQVKFVPSFFEIQPPTADDYAAFDGMGLVMEFLGQRVMREAAAGSSVPVLLTAVEVGPGLSGRREMISLDLSEYGDPLHTRMVRMPFTRYLKRRKWGISDAGDEIRALPINGLDTMEALAIRGDTEAVKDLCHSIDSAIPGSDTGMQHLIDAYLESPLRRFHHYYFGAAPHSREQYYEALQRIRQEPYPPCVRAVLEHPNDLLLKPAGMQLVVRTLVGQGWHPRHVGGLIAMIFADPGHQWGDIWDYYDTGRRADFYARIFSGLMAVGLDELVDFNCVSNQQKGFCPGGDGICNLDPWRQAMRERIAKEFPEDTAALAGPHCAHPCWQAENPNRFIR